MKSYLNKIRKMHTEDIDNYSAVVWLHKISLCNIVWMTIRKVGNQNTNKQRDILTYITEVNMQILNYFSFQLDVNQVPSIFLNAK